MLVPILAMVKPSFLIVFAIMLPAWMPPALGT
jgi:hypothetical protein